MASLLQGSPLPNITTTQTQSTQAPSWYTDYLSNLANSTQGAATSAQYVGAQPLQQQAFSAAAALPGAYKRSMDEALGLASDVGKTDITSRVNDYMTPYTANVVNSLDVLGKRNINQYLAPQATASAVGSGQFGSKRGAEVLGQTINTGLQNLSATQAQALQAGYGQALTAAQADQASKLGASQQLGALSTAGQNLDLGAINAMATLGGQQQTIAQNKELFPLQNQLSAAGALRGYTIPTSVKSSYTGPIPGAYSASPLAQIAGLGSILGDISKSPFGKAIGAGLAKWWSSSGNSNPFATTVVNDQSQEENPMLGPDGRPGYWGDDGNWVTAV